MEAVTHVAALSTIEYVYRVRRNGWYDKQRQTILGRTKAAPHMWLLHNTRGNKESYEHPSLSEQEAWKSWSANETRKFYKKFSQSRNGFMP